MLKCLPKTNRFGLAGVSLVLVVAVAGVLRAADSKPNVLLIMADDLGFSDLGCYGGEIETPNLDGLAANGLRFSQFYNTARCWPTRAALLTGYYAQQVRRDTLPGVQSGGGNRGLRQPWAALLPRLLKPLGYRSYHSGKWHIDGMPLENGFDRSYYLRDQGRFFSPQIHFENDQKLPAVERGSGFYGTTAIGNHAVKCLKEHQEKYASQPFFHYLAFTAPHFPLHALPEDIEKYKARYRDGWQKVRARRWQRIQEMGLLSGELSAPESDLGPPYHFPDHLEILGDKEVNRPVPWQTLSSEQQAFQATKMAIHAAMIDRMDVMIGEVLEQIRLMNAKDNTLVFFLSDNGSSAEIMVRADGHDRNAAPGSAGSYLCLGPGWSTTGNTPFRRHKTWTHEGGTSTPLIVSWPKGIKQRGGFRRQIGHAIDIAPTILEAAGADRMKTLAAAGLTGSAGVPPFPGRSLLPVIQDNAELSRDCLWWLHDGHRAIQVDQWKAVSPKGEPWELYNLTTDRAQAEDLAAQKPDRLKTLVDLWTSKTAEFTEIAKRDLPKNVKKKRPAKSRSKSNR